MAQYEAPRAPSIKLEPIDGGAYRGAGLLGGLPVEVSVDPSTTGYKVEITCPMYMQKPDASGEAKPVLTCVDSVVRAGTIWQGEFVYFKKDRSGSWWLNLVAAPNTGAGGLDAL